MAHLVFFPEAFIELQKEILNHPVLRDRLAKHLDRDGELQFAKCVAEVCAYVNIALDDTYTEEDLIKIADLCIKRLRHKGMAIINTNQSSEKPSGIVDLNGNPIVKH